MDTRKKHGYGAALSAMFRGLLSMDGHASGMEACVAGRMPAVPATPGARKHEARRGAGLRVVERELERELRPRVPRGWR